MIRPNTACAIAIATAKWELVVWINSGRLLLIMFGGGNVRDGGGIYTPGIAPFLGDRGEYRSPYSETAHP